MPQPFVFSKQFRSDRCVRCGECLHRCPVLSLPLDAAQAEIRALAEGGASQVLNRCTGCMACNSFCPNAANPHALILSRWQDRIRVDGIPALGRLVLPYQEPNLYTLAVPRLPQDEQALIAQWEANWRRPPSDTMMYAGCNSLLLPFLLDSTAFDGLPVFGSPKLCCGEPFYRMGYGDAARVVAEHVRDEFRRMGLKQVVVPCLGGYNLFTHVYPEVFDVALDCEVVFVVPWLLDRIRDGRLQVTPVRKTAVLHDNCWPKASGETDFDSVRELLDLLGITVVEPRHTRQEALCCGMCACAARFSVGDVFRTARARLKEFAEVEADMVLDYCGGCSWIFALAGRFGSSRGQKPIHHLLEVVQMALGEPPRHCAPEAARAVLHAIAGRTLVERLNPHRFRVEQIGGRAVPHSSHVGR